MTTKQRSHNKRQELFCERCGRITVHTTDDPTQTSEWVTLPENIRAYRQSRDCTICGGTSGQPGEPIGWQFTVEMNEDDFNRVCKELDQLRQFRDTVQGALKSLKA